MVEETHRVENEKATENTVMIVDTCIFVHAYFKAIKVSEGMKSCGEL